MKEATGEVSMTVVTLVAIGVIGAILALFWPNLRNTITNLWNVTDSCGTGYYRDDDGNCQEIK